MYELAMWIRRWLWSLVGFAAVWALATAVARVLDSQSGTKVL